MQDKQKNKAAQELGRLRWKNKSKKERTEKMRELAKKKWEKWRKGLRNSYQIIIN